MNPSDAGKKGFDNSAKALAENRKHQRDEAIKRYEENPKFCPNCDNMLPYDKRYNKFCDSSCAASFNNVGVLRVEKSPQAFCAHCGNPVEKRQNKHCDACIAEAVYNKPQSLDVIKSDRGRRHFLIRQRGHQCQSCGNTEWLGDPIALEVDHIDGDSDNNTDENLRLLCPNCHAKTEFYKGAAATRGNGRHSIRRQKRRKRYQNGESY